MRLLIASAILALLAVTYGQECDCDGFLQCKDKENEERKNGIMQCMDSCKENLDAEVRNAFETCKPAKTGNELRKQYKSCMMRATCETSKGTENPEQPDENGGGRRGRKGGRKGGKGKSRGRNGKRGENNGQDRNDGNGGRRNGNGNKRGRQNGNKNDNGRRGGKRGGGKRGNRGMGPMKKLLSQLSKEQQTSLLEFKQCTKQCRKTVKGDKTCKNEHPSCKFNRKAKRNPDSAATNCTKPERQDKKAQRQEMCTCLVDNLGLSDASFCDKLAAKQRERVRGDRQGSAKRRRNQRSASDDDEEQEEDSNFGSFSSEEDHGEDADEGLAAVEDDFLFF